MNYRRFCIQALVISLFFLVCPPSLFAQTDTTAEIVDEVVVDTARFDSDDFEDEVEVPRGPVYFSDRSSQANGGGPDSLYLHKVPDTTKAAMKRDEDFWYVDAIFKKNKKAEPAPAQQSSSAWDSPFLQTLLWLVIIGGFVTVLIIYLSNSNVGLFRRKNRAITGTEDGDLETDNIFEINYQREIDKAVGKGNYRFAVRLMFLRLLKTLADRNVIQYKQDRTNFDYLLQLNSSRYYNDFFRLTRNYEYSWYGQFEIDRDKFSVIKNEFDSFDSKLSK